MEFSIQLIPVHRCVGLGLLLNTVLAAGYLAGGPQPGETLRATSREVLLDVVVRDKQRGLVRDLRAGEVQVLEDGVPQSISSFDFIRTKGSALLAARRPEPFDTWHELNFIAIVFQAMSVDARANARLMAQDFLRGEFPPNTLLGGFAINRRLYLLQPFTNRVSLMKAAVDTATTKSYGGFERISAENLESLSAVASGQGGNAVVDVSRWQPTSTGKADVRGPEADPVMLGLKRNIERMSATIVRRAEGLYSTESLLALIRTLAGIRGRKTVLFFSQGLSIDSDERLILQRLIREANRANVSFYSVNTNGLKAEDGQARVMKNIDAQPLRELAESTGGFAMDNSNDLRAPLRRVLEDSISHYELAYKPKSSDFDGKFHRIEVRVQRPGASVQTRNGYFAVPLVAGQFLEGFEIDCLKALNRDPRPRAFAFEHSFVRLPGTPDEARFQLVMKVPAGAARMKLEPGARVLTGALSAFALLRDGSGRVVDKMSGSLSLKVEAGRMEQPGQAPWIITLPFAAPPGLYSVDFVVLDHGSGQASVETAQLEAAPH